MANSTGGTDYSAATPELIPEIYKQNWENARQVRNERVSFMNTYVVVAAGVLSLLQSIRGEFVLQLSLIGFMCLFSLIGFVISLRLKAELEECLAHIHTMVVRAQVDDVVALGRIEGHIAPPAFRWVLPAIYALVTTMFVALFFYQLSLGPQT